MATMRTPLLAGAETKIRPQGRKNGGLRWILRIAAFISVPICTVLFLRWRRAVVPETIDHDYGIGFDLTSPYGTAAISYPNGTIVNVAQIYGSRRYQSMMSRLSLKSSEHLHPPYNSLNDGFNDQTREAFRYLRKQMGLPASSDVGEIANMILLLRSAVERYLGGSRISGAVPTTPHLTALYAEDLEDAFEYAGLLDISSYPFWFSRGSHYGETSASYVGNGFGLCTNYTDMTSCQQEKNNPPHQQLHEYILSISLTKTFLTSTYSHAGMWFPGAGADRYTVTDYGLGWDRRHDNPNQEYYWEAVRDALIKPALIPRDAYHGLVDRVVVRGDCSTDERFQKVLREAVEAALEKKPEIFAFDPVYSAARGAAEVAKRVYWTYNHTGKMQSIDNGDL